MRSVLMAIEVQLRHSGPRELGVRAHVGEYLTEIDVARQRLSRMLGPPALLRLLTETPARYQPAATSLLRQEQTRMQDGPAWESATKGAAVNYLIVGLDRETHGVARERLGGRHQYSEADHAGTRHGARDRPRGRRRVGPNSAVMSDSAGELAARAKGGQTKAAAASVLLEETLGSPCMAERNGRFDALTPGAPSPPHRNVTMTARPARAITSPHCPVALRIDEL